MGGLGDRPIKEFDEETPLEKAKTPNMDKLAKEGETGLFYSLDEKMVLESDAAIFSLLGYDLKSYPGRGVIEAIGAGMPFKNGDLALRANFASCRNKKIISRQAGQNLTSKEAKILAKEINEKVKLKNYSFVFKSTIGYRGILLIKGKNTLSGFISNTDPAYQRMGMKSVALKNFKNEIQNVRSILNFEDEKAKKTAEIINEWSLKVQKVLGKSKLNKERIKNGKLAANCILLRDAGTNLSSSISSIQEITGLKWGAFASMPAEKGICKILGIKIIKHPFFKNLERTYAEWVGIILKEIKKFNALYIYIKQLDEAGHSGDFMKKKEIIELIDKYFFANLISKIDKKKYLVAITADHSTPCSLRVNLSDAAPLLIWGDKIKKDLVNKFSEKDCQNGKLGVIKDGELMRKIIRIAANN